MKTEIFKSAIRNRNRVKFLYGLDEIILEPYYIATERNGSRVIYGKVLHSSEIKKFNFSRIANIKVMNSIKFSPIIPIIQLVS